MPAQTTSKQIFTITTPLCTRYERLSVGRAAPAEWGGFTSEVRAVRQLGVFAALGQDADHAVLDEVHLLADGALSDDVVARLEDLEAQLGQHGGDEVGVGVGEQGHGGHQFATIKVDDFLQEKWRSLVIIVIFQAAFPTPGPLHVYVSIIIKAA